MIKRKITNPHDVEFVPFDNYGVVVPGMSWHKISYSKEDGGHRDEYHAHGGDDQEVRVNDRAETFRFAPGSDRNYDD